MKINVLWGISDKIALALSAGVDSIALLNLLLTEYKDTYKELVIFHVNHGFRAESEEEAIFAQSLAEKNGIRFYKKDLNLNSIKKTHISQEMLAREYRYAAFEEFSRQSGVNKVLTGHHKNDNLENIFLRLLSSRAIDHRLDIEEDTFIGNLNILRPMLDLEKSQIEDYANKEKLEYRQDMTNYDIAYTRNYIRHEIIPHLEKVNEAAYKNTISFAKHYKELQDYAKINFLKKLERLDLKIEEKSVTIRQEDYFKLTDLEKYMYISTILNEKLEEYDVSRSSIQAAIRDINKENNNISFDLKNNTKIIKEYQSISISKFEKKCYNDKIIINIDETKEIYDFTKYKICLSKDNQDAEYGFNKEDFPLLIRTKQEGDRIQRGSIKKKISRLFIDYKIPKLERKILPLIENKEGEIIAVLGLGNKVSEKRKYDYYIKILKG